MYMAAAAAVDEKDKLIEYLKSNMSFTRMQEMKAELTAYADECSRLSLEVKRLSNHQHQQRVHDLEEQVKNLKSVASFLIKKLKDAQKHERNTMQVLAPRPKTTYEEVDARRESNEKETEIGTKKERDIALLQNNMKTEKNEAHEQEDVSAST
ncbi:hypothetical protein NCLIV_023860 [Neospora caninum Liverpool]|uniref:Uncharacterized protein n=1 Tax=Neospora caninum (strain Liverpool) TaxID=572307 RepID=F0VFV3_NEOCL|nr:hypothetical protein NCLIV_023860 [Neospora caninum Liverpool]CBZ52597.1 hypothetical protein NCLIV_023860 [Neospora caninum Liverpool]CEL66575.1 TPA: hypothetical protein BN1204_023860 [Neospora caninum Liverpool]|eukprot:XP_003882629.1 hypothetical protein NCLIV_023860 [Neospora caninum Liverpool]